MPQRIQASARFSGAGGFFATAIGPSRITYQEFAGRGSLVVDATVRAVIAQAAARFAGYGSLRLSALQRQAAIARFIGDGAFRITIQTIANKAKFDGRGAFHARAWLKVPSSLAFQSNAFQSDAFQASEFLRPPDGIRVGNLRISTPTITFQQWAQFGAITVNAELNVVAKIETVVSFGNIVIHGEIERGPIPYVTVREFDRHIRRDGDAYSEALVTLFPNGIAWPKWRHDSIFMKLVKGLGEYWGFVDSRAADLLERESDPRKTIELLPDWERAYGLPGECFTQPNSVSERQKRLVWHMTLLGAQSRDWFRYAASLEGHNIRIREYAPVMAGVTRCGDTYDETVEYIYPGEDVTKQSDSLNFNGSTDDFYFNSNFGLTSSDFSFVIRFKTTHTQGILFQQQSTSSTPGTATSWLPALFIDADGRLNGMQEGSWVTTLKSPLAVIDGQWHSAGLTIDNDGGNATLYLDGVRVDSAIGNPGAYSWWTNTWIGTGKGDTIIHNGACWFNGSLAEARIYNRALSHEEIGMIHGQVEVETGLIGYYPMTLANAVDQSGNNNDGTVQGSPDVEIEGGPMTIVVSGPPPMINPLSQHWQFGPQEMRFYWAVNADDAQLTWFRVTAGQSGIDPHLRIRIAIDLDCLIDKWRPAQTDTVFSYEELAVGGPMQGTP